MVGWLYIDEQVSAPVRVVEIDATTGLLSIEVASKFVPNRSSLRGQTVLEYRGWQRRRLVRCLGAEEVGASMMIEAVDLGLADPSLAEDGGHDGPAEDWLVVEGRARCRVRGTRVGCCPGSMVRHCLIHVPLTDWRDLRIGETAALARVGVPHADMDGGDGSITPTLHCARPPQPDDLPPRVELVRLREREKLTIQPLATDWGEDTTLVVCRVMQASLLGKSA